MSILFINQAFIPNIIILGDQTGIAFSLLSFPDEANSNNNLFLISKIFALLNVNKQMLRYISIVQGPGSFTGTRVSVVDAKIIAYSLSLPVYALNSLDCIGAHTKGSTTIILPAYRKEFFAAKFENGKRISGDEIMSQEEIEKTCRDIASTDESVGRFFEKFTKVELSPELILQLVIDKLNKNEKIRDPLSLNPIYLRSTDVIFKKTRNE